MEKRDYVNFFLTIPHLPRGILLWTSFIFWNPLFQCSCFFCPRYCGKPHYLLSNEHSQQQRVFRGGGVSGTKSVARTDCSWQGRNTTSVHQSDPTYSLMQHFAALCSNTADVHSLSAFQPHKKMEGTGTTVQMQCYKCISHVIQQNHLYWSDRR